MITDRPPDVMRCDRACDLNDIKQEQIGMPSCLKCTVIATNDLIPRILQSSCQNSESNWGPLSDIVLLGSPKWE
jgi:hypothetical protein